MKLFLASSLDETISLLKQRIPESMNRVVFVANAADPFDDRWWVDLDREAFKKSGFEIIEVDLRKISKDELEGKLKNTDILHFCGGSVFYLLSILKQKDVAGLITDYVKNNKVVYTGTSAGSIISASSLSLYRYDTEEVKFFKNDADSSGLGLVDFIILPHCNNLEFAENNKNVVERANESPAPLLLLQDSQAVWVEDKKIEILFLNG